MVLYSFDEMRNPNGCCIVNFQALEFASPANDLNNLLFSCLDAEIRMKIHMKAMKIYRDEFERICRLGKTEINFSLEDLLSESQRKYIHIILKFSKLFHKEGFKSLSLFKRFFCMLNEMEAVGSFNIHPYELMTRGINFIW